MNLPACQGRLRPALAVIALGVALSGCASGYSNPDVDRWIEEVDTSLDHTRRAELLARIADQRERDLPLIPLVLLSDVYGLDRRLAFSPRADRRIDATSFRWEDAGG